MVAVVPGVIVAASDEFGLTSSVAAPRTLGTSRGFVAAERC
jgi:hypothetical protein